MELDYVGISLLVTAVLTGIAGIVGNWRTGTRVAAVEAKVIPLVEKVNENLAETKAVKHATNSAATKAETEAEATRKEITQLREQLGEAKLNAALLQQTQSQQVAVAAAKAVKTVAQIVEAGVNELNGHAPAEASLKKIEENTKDTAQNTARTGAVVEQLKDKA